MTTLYIAQSFFTQSTQLGKAIRCTRQRPRSRAAFNGIPDRERFAACAEASRS